MDVFNDIQLNADEHKITLPWYLRTGTAYAGVLEGHDAKMRRYTLCCHTLPDIFESEELNCLVSWEERIAIAYIGESRAMDILYEETPGIQWR